MVDLCGKIAYIQNTVKGCDMLLYDPKLLSKAINYDCRSGLFTWKARTPDMFSDTNGVSAEWKCKKFNSTFGGKQALTSTSYGYNVGSFMGKSIKAHRVAWCIYYDEFPPEFIDHINNDRSDNRIENLRSASRCENNRNVTSAIGSTSKFLGVFWDKHRGKWAANIKIDGKSRYLGRFFCETEAAKAYDAAAILHFKDYSSLNFPLKPFC